MPAELREHLRYPEDLFRVQTDVYSKYQLEPERLLRARGRLVGGPGAERRSPRAVDAAARRRRPRRRPTTQAPTDLASESSTSRFIPYYTMFARRRRARATEFVLLRPFVPFSRDDQRTELQAYMTASSDPETYGQLTAYVVDGTGACRRAAHGRQPRLRPADQRADHAADQGGGNQVRFGDLQLVPIRRQGEDAGQGLLYVRPLYLTVQRSSSTTPTESTYRYVMVSADNGTSVYASTIGGALGQLFPGFGVDLGERAPGGSTDASTGLPGGTGSTTGAGGPSDATVTLGEHAGAAAHRRRRLLREADDDLRVNGDLGSYQEKVNQATDLVTQALTLMGVAPTADTLPALVPTGSVPPRRRPDAAAADRLGPGALEVLGETGEVLAERDLVAGLLVGEAHLGVAHLLQRSLVDGSRRPRGEGVDVAPELGELVGELGGHRRDAGVERGELGDHGVDPRAQVVELGQRREVHGRRRRGRRVGRLDGRRRPPGRVGGRRRIERPSVTSG